MNQSAIKDDILRLLEEIVNRTHRITRDHPAKDPSLEIDLIRDDLRLLYRHFEMFGAQQEAPAAPEPEQAPVPEPAAHEPEQTPATESVASEHVSATEAVAPETAKPEDADIQPPSAPEDDTVREEPLRPAPEKPKTNNGVKAVIDILSEYSNRTIGDQYMKEEDDSLHQRISGEKEDKSIGTRMQTHPITNLKEAIGVNEKFLFINELFGGNIEDYREAIARLNGMEDMKAAFDYLNQLGRDYSWDGNRSVATIEKLANLVQRRHM